MDGNKIKLNKGDTARVQAVRFGGGDTDKYLLDYQTHCFVPVERSDLDFPKTANQKPIDTK